MLTDAKFTWKSLLAVLSALAGSLSAANVAGLHLPTAVSVALVAIGGAILSWERLAEAIDNAVKSWWASLPQSAQTELEHVAATVEHAKLTEDARKELADLLAEARAEIVRLHDVIEKTVVPPYVQQMATGVAPVVLEHPLAHTRPATNPPPPEPTVQP